MLFHVKEVDHQYYRQKLADFLPRRIIDFHTHVWLKEFRLEAPSAGRGQNWPHLVAEDNSIEDLLETYRLMLPEQQVTPLVFGWPDRSADLEATNAYTNQAAREHRLPSLMVTRPEWSAAELERRVQSGGFLGLKPYLNWAPLNIPSGEITIFDFLPHAHLEVADAHGWIVLLHIPRAARLGDPLNLQHILEIERRYPRLQLVIAHVGRAYCPEDLGNAMEVLGSSKRMSFDFSANTNEYVIEQALRTFGPQRLVFGSDLPILRMRMRRICEGGRYINLVPPGLYGDVSDDPHMRAVSQEDGEKLSFFMYEELNAFRCAAEAVSLTSEEVDAVFYHNGARLIQSVKVNAG